MKVSGYSLAERVVGLLHLLVVVVHKVGFLRLQLLSQRLLSVGKVLQALLQPNDAPCQQSLKSFYLFAVRSPKVFEKLQRPSCFL